MFKNTFSMVMKIAIPNIGAEYTSRKLDCIIEESKKVANPITKHKTPMEIVTVLKKSFFCASLLHSQYSLSKERSSVNV